MAMRSTTLTRAFFAFLLITALPAVGRAQDQAEPAARQQGEAAQPQAWAQQG